MGKREQIEYSTHQSEGLAHCYDRAVICPQFVNAVFSARVRLCM